MALNPGVAWEVRTTGLDTNSGGFDNTVASPGTDFSLQDSPQQAYTDLVAATGTTITSAGRPFSSVDVGNTLRISSGTGWTTGIYTIISVSGVTATVDRTIATGGSTGGTGKFGGALLTIAAANTDAVQGNIIWIKSGTYTVTTTLTLSKQVITGSGVTSGPIQFIGYGSSRGDTTRATWTTATNSIDLIQFTQAKGYTFKNILFSNTAGTRAVCLNAKTTGNTDGLALYNCVLDGFSVGILGKFSVDWSFNSIVLYNSEIKNCTSHGIQSDGFTILIGCYIHDNTGDGVQNEATAGSVGHGNITVIDSVIKSNGGVGINSQMEQSTLTTFCSPIIFNSAIINNTGDGIKIALTGGAGGFSNGIILRNCIIDSNGGFGVNFVRAYYLFNISANNAWRSNSSGDTQNYTKSSADITLTGDPFTNRASADFTLNNTAGAGAACRAAGSGLGF